MLFSVLGTVLLVGTVAAIPSSPLLRFRSLPDIPTACQTGCAPFVDFLLGASCPLTECCLPIFQTGYFDCFGCVGNATHATDYTVAQEFVDVLTTSCNSQGFGLPELTFPGQNPDRTLATALPPGASSLPIFTSAPASSTGTSGSTVRRSTTASSISRTVTPSFLSSSASSHPQSSGPATVVPPLSHSTAPSAPSAPLSQSITASAPFTQSTVTSAVPISQSTATSPPTSAGAGTPAPSSSAPSNAAMRSRLDFDHIVAGVFLCVTIALLA